MKNLKVVAIVIAVLCLITTSVFAVQVVGKKNQSKSQVSTNVEKIKERHNFLGRLVKDGTITKEQADAIKSALKDGRESKKPLDEVMDGLVKAGTITQEQKDKVLATLKECFKKFHSNDPVNRLVKKGKMTKEQGKAIKDAVKTSIDGLVTAGTITKDQKDDLVKEYRRSCFKRCHHRHFFGKLIKEGIITKDQAKAIHKAMRDARGTDKSKEDVLADLVKAETITQAQADAVLKVFSERHNKIDNK